MSAPSYRLRLTVATVSWTLVLFGVSGASVADVPEWIADPESEEGLPLWVSPEEAAPGAGAIRWELLPQVQAEQLRSRLETLSPASAEDLRSGRCPEWIEISHTFAGDILPSSVEEALAKFQVVAAGSIVESRPGLLRGTPGTLHEVQVDRYFKSGKARPETLLVFHETTKLPIAGRLYCQYPARGPAQPCKGCRILLTLESAELDKKVILHPLDNELYFETEEGELSKPEFNRIQVDTMDDLLLQLRQSAGDPVKGTGAIKKAGRASKSFRSLWEPMESANELKDDY